jgi:hypothetical protein
MRSSFSRFGTSLLVLAPALSIACAEDHTYTPAVDATNTTGAVTTSSHGSEYGQTQSQSNAPGTLSDSPGSSHGGATPVLTRGDATPPLETQVPIRAAELCSIAEGAAQ